MIKELSNVVLTVDLPEHGLKAGDIGTIVLVHTKPGYEVEFMTLNGRTVAVVSLSPDQVRQVGARDMAHARSFRQGPSMVASRKSTVHGTRSNGAKAVTAKR
jgi:Domain of unknown function (DUF4926)